MVCKNCHNRVVKQQKKVNKLTSVFLLVAIVSIAGIMYIVQVNKLATMGCEIKDKEGTIEELEKRKESLKIRMARLRSMHNLEIEKERMQMKKPDEITYIEVNNPVALK